MENRSTITYTLATTRGLLTAPKLARILGADQRTVKQWAESGHIPAMRLGGLLRFDPVAVAVALGNAAVDVPEVK